MNESPILSLVSVDKDGCVRVASRGNITAAEMTLGVRNPLEALLGENWSGNRIIFDLSRTDFIDSTAIAWLISTSKQIRAGGGAFAIHSIVPRVRQMLDLLKIGRIIPVVSDENAARQLISGGGIAAQAA
jgi:anti-anti-sigma factor